MPNEIKDQFLRNIYNKYGVINQLDNSQSLFEIPGTNIKIYIRYSKLHPTMRAFFGIRSIDLRRLEGFSSFICFLWDGQVEPLLIPYADFEDVFASTSPANDGQYKVLIIIDGAETQLYFARVGRFNVEGYYGWNEIDNLISQSQHIRVPELSHAQVQTLIGSIGFNKNYEVWIPPYDRNSLDWNLTPKYPTRERIPHGFETISNILQEIDVLWIDKGSNKIHSLFEIEHSTPIYSGLLRFNDVHIISPNLDANYSIVSNDSRRSLFIRQLRRPTFSYSGLDELCTFLDYSNVYNWYLRFAKGEINEN